MSDLEQDRYPVGRFTRLAIPIDAAARAASIEAIAHTPGAVRGLVDGLPDAALDAPYRDGGWTIRQVVHHLPDSHLHAYVRMKLALTETAPLVKTYDEVRWS